MLEHGHVMGPTSLLTPANLVTLIHIYIAHSQLEKMVVNIIPLKWLWLTPVFTDPKITHRPMCCMCGVMTRQCELIKPSSTKTNGDSHSSIFVPIALLFSSSIYPVHSVRFILFFISRDSHARLSTWHVLRWYVPGCSKICARWSSSGSSHSFDPSLGVVEL